MIKKRLSILFALMILSVSLFQGLKDHNVTIYLTIGRAEGQAPKQLAEIYLDEELLFKDSILNHIFKAEIFKVKMKSGVHTFRVVSNSKVQNKANLFILFDQHIVIEYFDSCENKQPCLIFRNRLRQYYLE